MPERERFEAWWLDHFGDGDCAPDQAFIPGTSRTYAHDDVEDTWQAFQAGYAAAHEPQPIESAPLLQTFHGYTQEYGWVACRRYDDTDTACAAVPGSNLVRPTHWLPMPAPPHTEGEQL